MCIVASRTGAKFWFDMDLPKHVISISKEFPHDDWKEYTIYDVLNEKRRKNIIRLNYKRHHLIIKPCFIWVFYNKQDFPHHGWWIYIKTLYKDFGINFRNEYNEQLVLKVMQLFPCGVLPMLYNFKIWAEKFAETYHKKAWERTVQGVKSCWCLLNEYEKLIDIDVVLNNLKLKIE
jgi:hypothetical protein